MAATPTFRTGTTFVLTGKTCRVWRNTRTRVEYVASHGAGVEDTMHVSTRAALASLAAAGLIVAAA